MILRARNSALEEQYKQQGECCYYCKRSVPYELITKDHIKPLSKGNSLENNKVFACRTCNNMKGNRTFEEFKSLMIKRCCNILKDVIKQDWKISEKQLDMFRHHVKVIKTIDEVINNNNVPTIVFT
jgi:hypothetical protein